MPRPGEQRAWMPQGRAALKPVETRGLMVSREMFRVGTAAVGVGARGVRTRASPAARSALDLS